METIDTRIANLERTLNSIRQCTQPIDGHTDPNSINDCWAFVDEHIAGIKSIAKRNVFETWTLAYERTRGNNTLNYDLLQLRLGTVNFKYLKEDNNFKHLTEEV